MNNSPHTEHAETTLGCLDCMAANPMAYRRLALADARRILAALDRWAFEDRHRDENGADDWADLPWWRKMLARIGARR